MHTCVEPGTGEGADMEIWSSAADGRRERLLVSMCFGITSSTAAGVFVVISERSGLLCEVGDWRALGMSLALRLHNALRRATTI
jgi:hypothetical protein